MTNAVNSLKLVGDGDEIYVILAVEKAFGIRVSNAEASRCETVGDLFEIVCSKLNISEARGLRCPTALAFFRLRAALRRSGHMHRISSKTDLRTIFRPHAAKRLRVGLSKETDLELPPLELHPTSVTVLMLVIACGVAVSIWLGSWYPLLGSAILSVASASVLPKTIPERNARFGDFAASCAAWNYGRLSEQAGGTRRGDVWKALTTVVRESADTDFRGEINSQTRFFAARREPC